MFDLILPTFNFNLQYAHKLVADVPDEQMCAQPVPGRVMNHAAFTIGHLAWVNSNGRGFVLPPPPALVSEWRPLFGPGNVPLPDRSKYPSKEALLDLLDQGHKLLLEVTTLAKPEQLAQPVPERMRHRYTTMGALMAGLMTSHYSSHLGQLSAWRRAMGLPSVF